MATSYEDTYATLAKSLLLDVVKASDPSPGRAVDILTALRRESMDPAKPVTMSVIQSSKIGRALGRTVKACKKYRVADDNNDGWENARTSAEALIADFKKITEVEQRSATKRKDDINSGRPKRKLKSVDRFDSRSYDGDHGNAKKNNKASSKCKTAEGFNCPRCDTACPYDSKICPYCLLGCYYETGAGVQVLRDEDRGLSEGHKRKKKRGQDGMMDHDKVEDDAKLNHKGEIEGGPDVDVGQQDAITGPKMSSTFSPKAPGGPADGWAGIILEDPSIDDGAPDNGKLGGASISAAPTVRGPNKAGPGSGKYHHLTPCKSVVYLVNQATRQPYHRGPECCARPGTPAWKRLAPSTGAPRVRTRFVDEALGLPSAVTEMTERPRVAREDYPALFYTKKDYSLFTKELVESGAAIQYAKKVVINGKKKVAGMF